MAKEVSEPAFPSTADTWLRDYFAAHALAGLLANTTAERGRHERGEALAAVYAEVAYKHADAMLTERSK